MIKLSGNVVLVFEKLESSVCMADYETLRESPYCFHSWFIIDTGATFWPLVKERSCHFLVFEEEYLTFACTYDHVTIICERDKRELASLFSQQRTTSELLLNRT